MPTAATSPETEEKVRVLFYVTTVLTKCKKYKCPVTEFIGISRTAYCVPITDCRR